MGLLDKPTFPVTLTLSAELDLSKLHSTPHPSYTEHPSRAQWKTNYRLWQSSAGHRLSRWININSAHCQPSIYSHSHLAHMKVCEQKFPAVTYSDLPPQMAVNKQPRHIGGCIIISSSVSIITAMFTLDGAQCLIKYNISTGLSSLQKFLYHSIVLADCNICPVTTCGVYHKHYSLWHSNVSDRDR